MKVINCELTSEDALSINSILFISIWLLLISSFHLLQQHHILQLGPSVSFTQSSLYLNQNAPKCIKSEKTCRQKVANFAQNPPLLKSCMHTAEKDFTSSKAIWRLYRKQFTSSSEMHVQNYFINSSLPGTPTMKAYMFCNQWAHYSENLLIFWVSSCIETGWGGGAQKVQVILPPEISTGLNCFQAGLGHKTRIQKSYNFLPLWSNF